MLRSGKPASSQSNDNDALIKTPQPLKAQGAEARGATTEKDQEAATLDEVTFWHMVSGGLEAWDFKELSKNPSIWTPASLLQAC